MLLFRVLAMPEFKSLVSNKASEHIVDELVKGLRGGALDGSEGGAVITRNEFAFALLHAFKQMERDIVDEFKEKLNDEYTRMLRDVREGPTIIVERDGHVSESRGFTGAAGVVGGVVVVEPEKKKKKKIERSSAMKAPRAHSKSKPATLRATCGDATLLDSSRADSSWVFRDTLYSGSYTFGEMGQMDKAKGQIVEGIEKLKAEPHKYLGVFYQANMTSWPAEQQQYTLIHRKGTTGFKPDGESGEEGNWRIHIASYQALPPLQKLGNADKYTDGGSLAQYEGKRLEKAVCPGRGQGVGDMPGLKIIGDIDPSDISQGSVGNCWLLSGISSLAEFDGAISHLFRRTADVQPILFGMLRGDDANDVVA